MFKKYGGRNILSESLYGSPKEIARYHDLITQINQLSCSAQPTAFHQLFDTLARQGKLCHLFTQNIDGLETRQPWLYTQRPLGDISEDPPNTTELHGNAQWEYCRLCRHSSAIRLRDFQSDTPPECIKCTKSIEMDARHKDKRATRKGGRRRPRVLLYDDLEGIEPEAIQAMVQHVLDQRPDVLIVGGSALQNKGIRGLVKSIAAVVHNPEPKEEGKVEEDEEEDEEAEEDEVEEMEEDENEQFTRKTIWVNIKEPRKEFVKPDQRVFDYAVKGTCDDFANLVAEAALFVPTSVEDV
jgi:NAD-dependent SIR2 family protein deacetylase